jgi:hypothetical protein
MPEARELEYYHYLDEDTLDMLYAQCGEFLVERLTGHEDKGALDAGAQVEIGKLLALMGLASGKAEGKIALSALKTDSMKSVFRVEQRIPIIMNFLEKKGELQRLSESSETASEGYVFLEARFIPPDFAEVLEGAKVDSTSAMFAALFGNRNAMKPTGFVQFRSACAFGSVAMGSSLAKYKTGLQHLMLMWHATGGSSTPVSLKVFGHLSGHREGGFYVKPFLIAQA